MALSAAAAMGGRINQDYEVPLKPILGLTPRSLDDAIAHSATRKTPDDALPDRLHLGAGEC